MPPDLGHVVRQTAPLAPFEEYLQVGLHPTGSFSVPVIVDEFGQNALCVPLGAMFASVQVFCSGAGIEAELGTQTF